MTARDRWNERYAAAAPDREPAGFLVARAALLPAGGRALDVGGGAGRNAVWLAERGLDVTLVDVSDEACELARRLARARAVELDVRRRDVEADGLPPGPWDVVLFHHHLDRRALVEAASALAPGGVLLLCQPTVTNLERHARPSRRWLLERGELARLVAPLRGMEIVELREAWTDDGRHEAHLVLRRAAGLA